MISNPTIPTERFLPSLSSGENRRTHRRLAHRLRQAEKAWIDDELLTSEDHR